ncbi:MAG TPA: hypothetical protein IAC24_04795 [Candidatus Onthousia faecigallinarum]|nr:hypothetical protein [Candidatus Onthousia faecigallinarum]
MEHIKKKKNFREILCLIFYFLFTLSFSYVFVNCFFREISVYQKFHSWIYLLLGIFDLFLWCFLYKAIKKIFTKLSKKQVILVFAVTFLFAIGVLIAVSNLFEAPLAWDFGVVYAQADSYVRTGDRNLLATYPEYFQLFPNNIAIFLIEVVIFRIGKFFGFTDFASVGIFFNGIAIFLSIFFLVLYCYRRFGKEKAYFSLIISFFFFPLFLYLPIFYSDTLSVAVGPFLLFLSTFMEDKKWKKNILLCCIMALSLFIGMKIKMTVIFFLLGFLFLFFIQKKYKLLFMFSLVFLIGYVGLNQIYQKVVVERGSFSFQVNDYGKIPVTHWLMMGIEDSKADNSSRNAYGGYNLNDYNITQSYEKGEDSIPRHKKEIIKRLKEYGFFGYLDYLTKKAVNAWGDGSYYVQIALTLNKEVNQKGEVQHFLTGKSSDTIFYLEEGVQIAFLFILCFSGFYCFKTKSKETLVEHISIFLLFLFLLVWENRSRYLYNYIPIFIIIITVYIDKLKYFGGHYGKNIKKRKKNFKLD